MEIHIDFLKFFDTDMALIILSKLDDPADLVRAAAVSHSWRQFVITNCLSKNLCLKKAPVIANIKAMIEQEETLTIDHRTKCPLFKILEKDHHMYCYLLEALSKSLIAPKNCIECVVGASSTDHYPQESIVNILVPSDQSSWGASYWSSSGHSDPSVPETILFKLNGGVCIVTEINIQPFKCYWERGSPIYSANSVRFRMGYPRSSRDLNIDVESLPLQQLDDDNYVWEYTSPEYPLRQESSLQSFHLPEPVLCIGGYLQVELLGRTQIEEFDGLYYICINHVRVLGHSLKPAFDVEMGSSGLISLKYSQAAVKDVLQHIVQPDEENMSADDMFETLPPNDALWLSQIEDLSQRLALFVVN